MSAMDYAYPMTEGEMEFLWRMAGHNRQGMIQIGRRVRKSVLETNDLHQVGSFATVMGVIPKEALPQSRDFPGAYLVTWDDMPSAMSFVVASKVVEVPADAAPNTTSTH